MESTEFVTAVKSIAQQSMEVGELHTANSFFVRNQPLNFRAGAYAKGDLPCVCWF